jgi:myosin heavy subunit
LPTKREQVEYKIDLFLEKNRENFQVGAGLGSSRNAFLLQVLGGIEVSKSATLHENKFGTAMNFKVSRARNRREKENWHADVDFSKTDLNHLMDVLSATENSIYFIKCIKPNSNPILNRSPDRLAHFDTEFVRIQIENSGIVQAMQVRRFGFPFKFSHAEFFQRSV